MTSTNSQTRKQHSHTLVTLLPPLRRLARILAPTPDQAEDLAQEALVKVWARLQRGADIDDLRPYLMTTLRNANRTPRPQEQELTDDNTPSCPPQAWGRMVVQDVSDAIENLAEDQSNLLRPLVQQGTSYKKLAKLHGLPIGTVMSRIARARTRLRSDLGLPADHAVEALLDGAE
ncbi:MAG: sigma-70 family RNA polymerase sigma factor [Paracoccaceae bacterium]